VDLLDCSRHRFHCQAGGCLFAARHPADHLPWAPQPPGYEEPTV